MVIDRAIKKGYNQTDLSVIPEGWEMQSLEGITDPKISICYGIVQVGSFVSNGIPVLAIKNLNTDYSTNVYRSSPAIEALYARSRVCPGDVLISVKGTTGRIGIVPQYFVGNISRDLARLRLTERDVPEFWFQMLQSESAQRRLGLATVGTTRMELSIGILKQIRMLRPPKVEQQAIATVLSDVDALITSLDKLIAKKRDIKQATMQQLLTGKTRLPGFSEGIKQPYKQTEAGLIPEDWEVKLVSEIANVKGGKRLPAGKTLSDSPTPYPYVRITDVFPGGVSLNEIKYVPTDVFPSIKNYRISKDDIFITVAGTLGIIGKIPLELDGANLTENADKITNIICNKDYLLYTLTSPRIQKMIEAEKTVGAQPKLALNRIEHFHIALPIDIVEQTAIATVLTDMDAEIAALEQKREKTRMMKQGMMQELLTGKIRLT